LERLSVNTSSRERFTSLYKSARKRLFTPKSIRAGFAASGLFLFNPGRVLRTTLKPPAKLTLVVTNKAPC
jgi:hypothetical protein